MFANYSPIPVRRPGRPRLGAPRFVLLLLLLTLLPALPACGGSTGGGASEPAALRDISEARAFELCNEAMLAQGISLTSAWPINDGRGEPFEVDFRIAETSYGIEWVSPQDRVDFGDRLPNPDPSGQLQTFAGHGADSGVQVLVLDHRSYQYDLDRERVQQGATGAGDAESRLVRDLRDFVRYLQGEGAL